ncbi:unnamed protein product [Brachionus calyciflorus]|uniref:Rho-GAP domain-containing protein n=1 Tax=Brachionus calyciflorus TaxID=104777 RepID=A0A813RYT5_9BILA|nr:unnamed protein product [Brachionus calyciflorus]
MSSNVNNNNNNELDNNIDDAIYYAKLINFGKKSNQFYQQQQQLNNKSINKKMNIYEDITDLTNSDLVVNSTNQQQQQQQPQRSLKTKRLALNQQQNNKQNQMIINQIYKDNLNNILNKQQQQQQQLKANNNEQLLFKLIKTNSSTSTSPCSTSTSSTSSTSSTTSSKITKKSTTTNSSLSNSQSSTLLVKKKPYTQPDLNTYLQYSLITTQIPKQHKSSDESNDEDCPTQTIQKNFDLLVLKPSNTNNSNKLAQNSNLHDSTLLTPLHHNTAPKTLNKKISIDSISSPTPVPFDSFNYFNKLNKNSNSPAEQNQQQVNSVKSASTSYLLSKISSLANLTLPKNRPSITPTSTTANSSSSSSSSAQQSPIMNQQGLMNNLANKTTKFFNRKLSQQTLELSTTPLSSNSYLILSSSSVNSIDQETQSPSLTMDYLDENNLDDVCCDEEVNCLIGQQNLDYNDCASSSKIGYKTVQRIKNLKSASSSSSSTKSSISSSTNHVNVTTTTATTSSRRPFKKRSQSIHANLDNKIWFYNPAEECWYMTGPLSSLSKSDTAKQQLASSSSSSYSSSNSFLDNLDSNHVKKIKLNDIQIKYLTLIELKYLKQICFNKSQKYFEQSYAQQRDSTNSQQSKTFCIPKDESMKTIKTKNIQSMTTRSRSVDFKFFEDIKENYFFKKSQKENAELVFGQTLYKCILNDLKKSSSTSRMNSSKPKQSLPLSVNKKWKSNNSNLIIASKFDLNILNGINPNPNPKQNMDSFYSKRNSVLFEALDLKNTNFNKVIPNNNNPPNNQKTSEPTQNSVQFNTNNQNLSIRSEGLVPNIVKSCCKHISEHGIDVVGIFRIDSSKKRIKELKEMYDSGKDVVLGESFNTNDAACLLKEYLRSLPEPLLTRDLYSSFLATNKITDRNLRLEIVRNLICLLPVPNRDTLEVLLKLLDKIRSYAEPINENDKIIGGNKMDAFNLAMVFGPNLLKKHKLSQISLNSKANDMTNDKYNIIDDIDSVISVTKYLIENQDLIFSIDSALHNELIQTINNITPSEVELIMNRKIVSSIGVSILDPNPSGLLSENNSELANTYSSSNNAPQKPSPSEESSTSGSYCSSTNELDKLIQSNSLNSLSHNNFSENVDFIDNGTSTRNRTSRTKLHKISNNLAYQNETICFVNSPSHSPRPVINKPKRISEPYKYGENLNDNFYQNKPVMQNQGSLLLMIQSNQGNNQRPKLRQTDSILKENKSERLIMSKSIRSLSNLNLENNPELNSDTQTHRINLNSSKLCSKFFDKSKFNTIGEQETLV